MLSLLQTDDIIINASEARISCKVQLTGGTGSFINSTLQQWAELRLLEIEKIPSNQPRAHGGARRTVIQGTKVPSAQWPSNNKQKILSLFEKFNINVNDWDDLINKMKNKEKKKEKEKEKEKIQSQNKGSETEAEKEQSEDEQKAEITPTSSRIGRRIANMHSLRHRGGANNTQPIMSSMNGNNYDENIYRSENFNDDNHNSNSNNNIDFSQYNT